LTLAVSRITVRTVTDLLTALASESGDADPLKALRALRSMRTELDRQEGALVRKARNLGYGWQMIATALGVTRQAVHKKYGRS
jgi:DNA invertase Pin-like site-specific DNA recombinase